MVGVLAVEATEVTAEVAVEGVVTEVGEEHMEVETSGGLKVEETMEGLKEEGIMVDPKEAQEWVLTEVMEIQDPLDNLLLTTRI